MSIWRGFRDERFQPLLSTICFLESVNSSLAPDLAAFGAKLFSNGFSECFPRFFLSPTDFVALEPVCMYV